MNTPTVALGERRSKALSNVPRIRANEVMTFIHHALRDAPELQAIRDRVDHATGRPRALSVSVLLAAAIAAAATGNSAMHVRGVAAFLRALPVPEQRVLGVRWVDPHGGGEKLITERQVEYLFGQIAQAFDLNVAAHNHVFVSGDDIWTPDGEWVRPLEGTDDDERAVLECSPTCPHALGMETLGNQLLARLWTYTGLPDSDRWAVDSTVVETHFATLSHGAKTDINPDYLPETERHKALGASKPRGVKTIHKDAMELFEAFTPPCVEPSSRRPAWVGPKAPGDFTRFHPEFPRIGPDGRPQHTKDPGARNAFRGWGNARPSMIINGRDKHALVSSGMFPDGTPMPPLTRAYRATPGGDAKDSALLTLLEYAESTHVAPGVITADRIYSMCKAEDLEHPLKERGWTLIRDLIVYQRERQQWTTGVHYLDGWWFTSGLPTGLVDIPRPAMRASSDERRASQTQFDNRSAFAFRTNGTTTAGNLRLRGPAVPDAITRNPDTGTVTAVRGVRVRCANSPYVHLLPRTITATTCVKGQPCGCNTTLTVKAEQIPNSCEPLLWGTTKWAKEYHRRNLSEAAFSVEQHHYGLGRHSIRVRAHKWDLAFAIINLSTFVRQFHSLVMRLGAYALDPGYYSALSPEVFTPAIARVLTPRFRKRTPSRGDPPDH